jgi:poly(3-hydroxybutyrate) depolymerase
MNRLHYGRGRHLAIVLSAFVALAAACSSSPGGGTNVASSGSSQNPTTGSAGGGGSSSGSVSSGTSSPASGTAGATTGSVSSGGTVSSGSAVSGTGMATSGDTGTMSGASSGSGSTTSSGAATGASTGGASGTEAASGNTDTLPLGKSAGCGSPPPAMDASGMFVMHDIMVTGVDPAFIAANPAQPPGSWTDRVYYVDLPSNYDPTKAYPVLFAGNGCGGNIGTNGSNGGDPRVLPQVNSQAILIGLSYVWPKGAGACFADGFSNTPDLPYFDSILAEVESNYCVDRGNLFVSGYSSGGWETYMLGLARGGTVIRGIATAAGGLRPVADRPPPSGKALAAILLTGATDTENPATGPTGSYAARDLILQTNGCVGTATTPWTVFMGGDCMQYTGCPADYPVIFCSGGGGGHTDGGGNYPPAIWSFWSGLPAVP